MEYTQVSSKAGTFRGFRLGRVEVFRGITYASARRFHAPQLLPPSQEIVNAANYGYVCPVMKFEKPSAELAVQHRYWPMDEDCLNLNIWTPGCDNCKRPVLVWLHGGAFSDGSSIEQVAYDGAAFSEYADAVVVSVNHRLNILGFFDLSEYGEEYRNSGNNGLMDLVCALQWIRKNIEAFGGDKDQVTLMGQSGGGSKITCLLQTPAADGLYARCINMSGVIPSLMPDDPGSTKPLVDAMLRELDISSVREMETVSWRALFDAYLKLRPEYEKQGCNTGCFAVKNDYFLGDPVTNGFRKETSQIPLVAGTCFGEFYAFEPLMHDRYEIAEEEALEMLRARMGRAKADRIVPLFKETYPDKKMIDLLMYDMLFRKPVIPFVRKRSRMNSCTYSYLFDAQMPLDGGKPPWHCSDIPFALHNTHLLELTKNDSAMKKVEEKVFGWVNAFLHTGDPNCSALPEWPACAGDEENIMIIGEPDQVRKNHDHKLIGN